MHAKTILVTYAKVFYVYFLAVYDAGLFFLYFSLVGHSFPKNKINLAQSSSYVTSTLILAYLFLFYRHLYSISFVVHGIIRKI